MKVSVKQKNTLAVCFTYNQGIKFALLLAADSIKLSLNIRNIVNMTNIYRLAERIRTAPNEPPWLICTSNCPEVALAITRSGRPSPFMSASSARVVFPSPLIADGARIESSL